MVNVSPREECMQHLTLRVSAFVSVTVQAPVRCFPAGRLGPALPCQLQHELVLDRLKPSVTA